VNELPHDRADDHLAVFRLLCETLAKTDDDRIVLHGDKGRHVEGLSHPGTTHLVEPWFALDRTSRCKLPGSKSYECHDLPNAVTLLEQGELRKNSSNGSLPDPGYGPYGGKKKRTCKRCDRDILNGTKCVEVPQPGTMGGKTYCRECAQKIVEKSREDLDRFEEALRV